MPLIVIAHRLSTLRKANLIVGIDWGEIEELSAHMELHKKQGHYFKQHQMQFEKYLKMA
jgi:ATP-binding cassette, subfamily B, multidrug efflux pump